MRSFVLIFFLIFLMTIAETEVYAQKQEIEMLPWEEVNEVLPRYSKFTVKDLETGKKFQVQRRAGSLHADVQPLTDKDTKVMKEIYNGKWSWKRRAIIVLSKEKKIAASMHGMPHGAGALKNNFPGHFCIHFYGSKTHRSNFMDLSHKLMILKAANELYPYLHSANPYDLANAYLAGIKQQDVKIVSATSLQKISWQEILPKILNLNLDRMAILPAEDITDELIVLVPVTISLQLEKTGLRSYDGNLRLVRLSPFDGWKVDSELFLEEIHM